MSSDTEIGPDPGQPRSGRSGFELAAPEEILYGQTPERSKTEAACDLDAFSTGSFYGYYHDHEGWSGTLVWMANAPRLPEAWLPDKELGRELKEPPDEFLCLLQDFNDGYIPELIPAEISYHTENPMYGPMLQIAVDDEEIVDDEEPLLVVPQAFLNAVEQLSDHRGSWYREWGYSGQLYYLDVEGIVLGVGWYGPAEQILPEDWT